MAINAKLEDSSLVCFAYDLVYLTVSVPGTYLSQNIAPLQTGDTSIDLRVNETNPPKHIKITRAIALFRKYLTSEIVSISQ